MRNYMRKLTDKLTALGYAVGNIQSKILSSGFSFEVNGTRILVTDKELKDVDSVVEYVVNHVNKEEKMKTVTETLKALVQDLDEIDSVVFGEHKGYVYINEIIIEIKDFDGNNIIAYIWVGDIKQYTVAPFTYSGLLEKINSLLKPHNKIDEIGLELSNYLKLDNYKIIDSEIEIKLPMEDKIKVRVIGGDVYCISHGVKTATRVGLEVMFDYEWKSSNIKTDSVKNLAKIIVLKYIYNF